MNLSLKLMFFTGLAYCVTGGSAKARVVLGLTHLPLDKMAANLTDDIFKCIFINEKFCISIRISLKFVPSGPIDNRSALVQVMAWRRTGDKPLSEQFTDAELGGDE